MSPFFKNFLLSLISLDPFRGNFNILSGTLLRQFQESMSDSTCDSPDTDLCRDDSAALTLKLVAISSILVAGATGISIPLLGRRKSFLATDGNLFIAAKAFAAGVILATAFVHMLPDGSENLTSSCLPSQPWSDFPFSGLIAMMAALVTLLVDFVATQLYERKMENVSGKGDGLSHELGINESLDSVSPAVIPPVDRLKVSDGGEAHDGHVVVVYGDGHGHGHSHSLRGDSSARRVVVSQVLELGIVSHSVLIGLSLGVSHNPCTIRPLVAALSFHQFFEGFALGGCIAQAQFKKMSTLIMACFFALTTPGGIAVGIGLASFYNPASPRALIIEGILDSISAGILVYMSLVDLIAAEFMGRTMRSNPRLQVVSYLALFLGATLMSGLAIWS